MDKSQLTKLTGRQKAIAIVVVVIAIVLIWQVIGMFSGGGSSTPTQTAAMQNMPGKTPNMNMQGDTPRSVKMPEQKASSQQETEFTRLQQETQQKYVYALTELQMLKLSQELAETNKKIAEAKSGTVRAEKDIIDLLAPPPPPTPENPKMRGDSVSNFQRLLALQQHPNQPAAPQQPAQAAKVPTTPAPLGTPEQEEQPDVKYDVISVSELKGKWNAVIGFNGKLYSTYVGDILPADNSTVVAIDKYGIMLERNGKARKISLIPLI